MLHGLFDFALLSGSAVLLDQQGYVGGAFAPILVYPVLAIVLFVKRRDIEPRDPPRDDRTVSPV